MDTIESWLATKKQPVLLPRTEFELCSWIASYLRDNGYLSPAPPPSGAVAGSAEMQKLEAREALEKAKQLLYAAAERGHYPVEALRENGGEGLGFMGRALSHLAALEASLPNPTNEELYKAAECR